VQTKWLHLPPPLVSALLQSASLRQPAVDPRRAVGAVAATVDYIPAEMATNSSGLVKAFISTLNTFPV
jgi:hypothetical protein